MGVVERWRSWARRLKLKRKVLARYLAIVCVVGYALSPIDLIPDALPVIGSLADLPAPS